MRFLPLCLVACTGGGTKTAVTETSDSGVTNQTTPSTTDSTVDCAAAWETPRVDVDPTVVRPDPATYPGVSISFTYVITGGQAVITFDRFTGRSRADAGFADDPYATSGKFAQLRDAQDQVLFTQDEYYLIEESIEVPGTPSGSGFENFTGCPDDGFVSLQDYPNDPAAAFLVILQEPIDGAVTSDPIGEVLRIPLP